MKNSRKQLMRRIALTALTSLVLLSLAGCNLFANEAGKMKEALAGRTVDISTYDENSNIIDKVSGKSVSINPDKKFEITNESGTVKESSVLEITIGGKSMHHVGSTLVMAESGLVNVFEEFAEEVDVQNFDRSIPFINSMYKRMKNNFSGEDKILLIRSQSGQPLATYAGKSVSHFATDVDKSTGFIIDGKYLFVYRADFTLYETSLLESN